MFRIPDGKKNEFKPLFDTHRLQIAACNVFYQNIRMLNNRHKILDRNAYKEYYHNIMADIELETSPIDAFVPCTDENSPDLFVVNQLVPEYERIKKRVTLDDIFETLPMTHEVHMKLKEDPTLLSTVVDDVFIYFCLFKYLSQIDMILLNIGSNITPIINYIVENISLRDVKDFICSRKINEEKYVKYCTDIFFNPDFSRVHKFYSDEHGDIPVIDVTQLMMKLATNIDLKSDIYIVLAMYMTLWFAISDIVNEKADDSPCVKYVRDVLSKI